VNTITILATGLAQGQISNGMSTIFKTIAKGDPNAHLKICSWRTDTQELMRYIGSKWTETGGSQIILAGHSWGVWMLTKLCVRLSASNIPVRLLASADGVSKPIRNPLVIPSNVIELQSWFQSKGIIKGSPIRVTSHTRHTISQQVVRRHFTVDEVPAFQKTVIDHALGRIT